MRGVCSMRPQLQVSYGRARPRPVTTRPPKTPSPARASATAITGTERLAKLPETSRTSASPSASDPTTPTRSVPTRASAGTITVTPSPSARHVTASMVIARRGARGEEEQGLEGGVVDGVIERRRQADHCQGRQPSRVVEDAGAEADQDDPHVLDRREGEHAFEIAVDDGRQHADHR